MASYSGDISEEEQAARAREERQQIVLRYDQGREDGAVIDDWEDPKFEIYHTQDRFGFIHDQRLPTTTRRTDEEKKAFDREMNRVDKWLKMLKEQPKWFPRGSRNHEKMVERVWKGVPERMRGSLWRILLDLDQIKAEQEGKYQEMRELARRHSPDIRQIDLDVNRTYRNHIMFRERYNTRQQDLFHVLGAYSIYNAEVGYCQGMSQIAALLLMYLNDDEDAFWALSQLMVGRRWNMHGFFIPGFPKLIRFQEHHDKILMKKLRRLQKHLIANGVDTGIYTLKWFFQCFLDRMPYSLTIRVWDLYLLEGEPIMFAMAYTILKLHRKALLKMGMDELLEFLQKTMETDFGFDDDYVIETALKESLAELRSSRLHTAGPPPDNEKPQKPFGLHSFPTPEEEASKARRNPITRGEKLFSEETARRGEEQSRRLAALNTSQVFCSTEENSSDTSDIKASMDDGSLGSADDTDEIISPPPPKSLTTPSLPPSPMPPNREQDDLDDSLQFMMRQATLSEGQHGEKKDERRRVHEVPRPASAEPSRLVEDRRGGGGHHQGGDRRSFGNSKRLSHHGHLNERSQSHSKSSFSASHSSMNQVLDTSRTSRTSSELTSGSSRLNTSQESNHRVNTSFESSSHHISATRESATRSPHTQRSARQGSSVREGRATPESRQRTGGRSAEDGRMTPSSRQKRQESGRETPETARQRRLQEESRRVVEARRAQEESRRAQEEQVSHRRSQEQSHWRKEEMQGVTKKSSYYFGEEPELSNGGIDLHDEEDSLTPTEEREGVREHAGEVVRIRVPYTEQDLTQQYNIQRLNAQKISPRFNGHKVTIQVNHGDGGARLDDSFSSEPPLSPATRRADTSRHYASQEKVGSSNCVHTTTHAMFVGEPRGNGEARGKRAPLAEQESEEPLNSNGHPVVRQPGRHPSHRHSLNESFSSSSEGDPRAQRHSTSGELRQTDQRVDELRRETFF